jgi:hypothetical protein
MPCGKVYQAWVAELESQHPLFDMQYISYFLQLGNGSVFPRQPELPKWE